MYGDGLEPVKKQTSLELGLMESEIVVPTANCRRLDNYLCDDLKKEGSRNVVVQ
jgi:hypothetical protein